MRIVAVPLVQMDPTKASFQVDFSNLKPGKQTAAVKFMQDLCASLSDGKLDLFEMIALVGDVRGVV